MVGRDGGLAAMLRTGDPKVGGSKRSAVSVCQYVLRQDPVIASLSCWTQDQRTDRPVVQTLYLRLIKQ